MPRNLLLTGVAVASLIGAPVHSQTAAPPPQLEAFLSYSFVSDLTGSKDGKQLAWVQLRKGVRNIWTASAPNFAPRQLTANTTDSGQELNDVAWSRDGRVLAWVSGAAEGNGWAAGMPAANPASLVVQPRVEVWVSVDGGTPISLGVGEAPTISPAGSITYLHEGQVWTANADGKTKAAKLFYDRGKVDSLAWSPDGTKLAFVSRRGDHSFVGIYSGPDTPIAWLAPSTAFDDAPAWSLDGQRVAFVRRTGEPEVLVSSLTETPHPFSILVATVADGNARIAWTSPATLNGSYPGVPDGMYLMWGAGDQLTFRAELDGWPHLYSLPAAGGQPLLLTPGEFMVEHVVSTPDRRALLFDANAGRVAGDIDRRHLFRIEIDRPGAVALTPGAGLEWTPAALSDGRIAYVAAAVATPPRVAIVDDRGQGARTIGVPTPGYPSSALVTPRPVTFTAADGVTVHGQLFEPKTDGARHPALIFVHGGPPRQMLLGWSYMDYYTHAYAMNQYLASRGYVILSVNYRLGIGYGRAFQHPAHAGATGNSEYQDVLAGARYLKGLPGVDDQRVGIWGGSYGGLLTAQALARDSDTFKAGVDFHGVHDWTLMPGGSAPKRYELGDYQRRRKLAFDSSPEAVLSTWRSPVLLIHGDDDRNVPFDQTVDLARLLAAKNIPYQELIIPNEIHGFLRYDSWLKADTAMVRFLDAKLVSGTVTERR